MKKKACDNSDNCLCGGSNSSVTPQEVKILSYDLFDMNESFMIVVNADV